MNAEDGSVWRDDLIVHNGRETNADIILGHASLPGDVSYLNLNINLS